MPARAMHCHGLIPGPDAMALVTGQQAQVAGLQFLLHVLREGRHGPALQFPLAGPHWWGGHRR